MAEAEFQIHELDLKNQSKSIFVELLRDISTPNFMVFKLNKTESDYLLI